MAVNVVSIKSVENRPMVSPVISTWGRIQAIHQCRKLGILSLSLSVSFFSFYHILTVVVQHQGVVVNRFRIMATRQNRQINTKLKSCEKCVLWTMFILIPKIDIEWVNLQNKKKLIFGTRRRLRHFPILFVYQIWRVFMCTSDMCALKTYNNMIYAQQIHQKFN